MDDIKHIETFVSGIGRGCPLNCGAQTWSGDDADEWLDQQTNHMLEVHGWQLLHVGSSTTRNVDDGSPWHQTVAVVGTPDHFEPGPAPTLELESSFDGPPVTVEFPEQ